MAFQRTSKRLRLLSKAVSPGFTERSDVVVLTRRIFLLCQSILTMLETAILKVKLDLFGEAKVAEDTAQLDPHKETMEALHSGFVQLLPVFVANEVHNSLQFVAKVRG
jgi:hypothetical protein